jgi:hypothetical protein
MWKLCITVWITSLQACYISYCDGGGGGGASGLAPVDSPPGVP